MQSKEKIKRFLSLFHSLEISWQIYTIVIIYIIITVIAMINDWKIGLLLVIFFLAGMLFLMINIDGVLQNINTIANNLSKEIKEAHEESFNKSPMSMLFYDENHRIKWLNPLMQQIIGHKDVLGEKIELVDTNLQNFLAVEDDKQWHIVPYHQSYYKVLHQIDNGRLYLIDVTYETKIKEQRKNDRVVFGYLLLDDYNEVIEAMDDRQEATFDAALLSEINRWTSNYKIYIKRIDDEKFILLMNQSTLDELEANKFKFFDELRQKNYAQNILISISMGIAYPQDELEDYRLDDLSRQAQLNLDLALGRGGDQIVVKSENDRARFYGGKTQQNQKRSNIRSRLIFQALQTQIEQADNVLIAGHKIPDLDSIGAAIGLNKIVRQYNRPSKILLNESLINSDIKELLIGFGQFGNHELFISPEAAEHIISDKTLIIMVDHHRPSISEGENLLDKGEIVIIDHHRRGEDFPNNVVLSYIEPNASSTSELITEFFMNMRYNKEGLSNFESTALLSGIIIDTNNFSLRTGSKTFDAASFLKSRGASNSQIQRLLKEDINDMKKRNRLVESVIIQNGYAITQTQDKEVLDNIIASQTADILLSIKGVEASFVIYRRDEETVGISARSLGKVNVQVIMERLNGGGHLSNAATQLKDVTVDQAYQELLEEIKKDQEED